MVLVCRGAAPAQWRDKQVPERAAEQPTHGAVKQEVDGTVNKNDDVPDVSKLSVDIIEDSVVDTAEKGEHALRQLRNNETQHDRNKHRCRPVVLASLLGLQSASLHLQQTSATVRPTHRHDQQSAEHCQ